MSAFHDQVGADDQLIDRIYSDGGGEYVDGAGTVGNKLFTLFGEQDWVLSFASKNSPRSVWISFADRLQGIGPTGTFKERPVINTHDIGSIAVGVSESRPVTMNTSQGKLHFDGQYGSTLASVHRVSATVWIIAVAPTVDAVQSFAALDRTAKGTTTFIGTYSMPFAVTVACVDATRCLP